METRRILRKYQFFQQIGVNQINGEVRKTKEFFDEKEKLGISTVEMHHLGFLRELKEKQEQMQNLHLGNLKDVMTPMASVREIPEQARMWPLRTSQEDQQQDQMKK